MDENRTQIRGVKVSLCGKKLKDSDYVFQNVADAYECATSKTVKICPKCKKIVIDKFKNAK
jgi:hypothetical protein